MSKRTYFKSSIIELEDIYKNNKNNSEICQVLLHELGFRTTARSQRLAALIQKSISHELHPQVIPSPPVAQQPAISETVAHPTTAETGETKFAQIELGPKPPVTNETKNILNAWTALEVLSPQGFKKEVDLTPADKYGVAYFNDAQLPWEKGESSRPKKRLYYELILGTMELGPAIEKLLKLYSDSRPDKPRVSNKVPLASILLDKEGRPLEEDTSCAVSSFAWGVPVALKGDLTKLASWTLEERSAVKSLRDRFLRRDENDEIIPLSKSSIEELFLLLVKRWNLQGHDIKAPYFALRRFEFFASKVPPEPSLLNSFFLEDLALAKSLANENNLPKALKYYLGENTPSDRIDLIESESGLRNLLQPAFTSLGRWPGPGRYPLALLQQAAVNATNSGIKATNIVAVNGPPGTGKTTLLRDIVAARIVERAEVMCKYDYPARAFQETKQSVQRQGAKVTLHKVDNRLKGFEMVVASSNNKAVENVSAELPSLQAIDSDTVGLRHLSSISDNVLKRETWGAVAAVLGNASNRYEFAQNFWRDEERGFSTYLNHVSGVLQYFTEPQEDGSSVKRLREVISLENPPNNKSEAKKNWDVAKRLFLESLKAAEVKRNTLQLIHNDILALIETKEAIEKYREEIEKTNSAINEIRELSANETVHFKAKKAGVTEAQAQADLHIGKKPGLFSRIFRTRSFRDWKITFQSLQGSLKQQKAGYRTSHEVLTKLYERYEVEKTTLTNLQEKVAQSESSLLGLRAQISEASKSIDATLPDESFFENGHETKQLSSLWFDKLSNIERDQVFESAMKVHKAFIDASADKLRQNLAIFTETFGTKSLGTPDKDNLLPDLWASFFMVVPVVSTTFASVHRMFSRLNIEALGWLLVDEAGQALPQAAVGAIMRSQKAVVVGDPLQIEPVVTLPNTLTEEICAYFGIEPLAYNAPEASVQTLADAASPYCAQFPIGSGYREVGSPLLVHRRCDSPMFEISNEIAYSNLMVQGKPQTSRETPLGPSCWFDVIGKPGPDKWCADEGHKLIELIAKLRRSGRDSDDFYVVTPFVIVQDNLRQKIKESGVLEGWGKKNPNNWVFEHVGTVHTVQGREASTVFFVLGAQSQSQNGARVWAGKRPNLVNVAVTRAKSSLYVIGNRKLWREAGVFKTLDRYLPVA